MTRRQFMAVVGGAALVVATGLDAYPDASTPGQPAIVFTPTEDFFQQQIGQVPHIAADHWTLTLGGMVKTALILSYDEVLRLPSVEMTGTLACIGNRPGGSMIGQALWLGTPLAGLLERAGLRRDARYARLMGWDGYSAVVDLAQLANALIVYGMNDQSLTPGHGFPVRLIVPGVYGYKMPKWLTQIAVTDTPYGGYWETLGWSQSGGVQTTSAIRTPNHMETVRGEVIVEGIAYAGERSIASVEVQINEGDWLTAALSPEMPNSWHTWRLVWTASAAGDYRLRVRATDASGATQVSLETRPFPDGSRGIHEITVQVR